MDFTKAAQLALEAAPIGVVMVDRRGRIVLVNAETERLFGYRRDELLGRPVEMLVPLSSRDGHPRFRAGFCASPHARAMGAGRDLFALRKDGSEFPVEIGLNPVETDDGLFVLSAIADITKRKTVEKQLQQLNATLEQQVAERTHEMEARAIEAQRTAETLRREIDQRRKAEQELRAAKEAAEAASHAKSTFLANMSHEIRTPLNAVIGLTDLVLETDLGEEQQEYLNLVRDSGEALLQVINDILDFSKIEAGRLDLVQTAFDHSEVVGDAVRSLAPRSHGKGLELLLHLPPEMPAAVIGDPHRLRQLIVNLIGNAIKFTDSGQVMLESTVRSRDDGHVELHYAVSDTGIGISCDKQASVFQAFEQVDGSAARRHGGTGLGLAICERLAELMGGRIWVESEVGQGTTFHFTARFEVSDETPPRPARWESLRGLPVLIVDDNDVNRHILMEMTRAWEMKPVEAADGEQALDLLRVACRAELPIPVVIIDSHMPRMSGFALAERIQHDPDLSSTRLLMLSSGDSPGDAARCRQLGIVAHLMKPAKQSELLRAITSAVGLNPGERRQAAPTASAQLPPLRVLVAEDSLTNQKLAMATLQRLGHEVVIAESGNMALDRLAAEQFDVVLMDVRMPDMDGLEATRIIRARERVHGGHVPVVALTANAMQGDRERCLEAGMDSYTTKPMQPAQLVAAISEALARRNAPAPIHTVLTASSKETGKGSPVASEASSQKSEPVDWELALKTTFHDEHVLADLVSDFLDESPRLLGQIREAVSRDESMSAERAAHTLKGQLNIFGAYDAAQIALRVERQIRDNGQDLKPLIDTLVDELDRVRAALIERFPRTPEQSSG